MVILCLFIGIGLMRSSRPGGPRAGTRPKAKPRAESRPEGPRDVMNACSTMATSISLKISNLWVKEF